MVNHLAIAKEFIKEKLKERNDIVAAYIGGSVSRGEETEASDVDLSLIVQGHPEPALQKLNVSDSKRMGTWREGIYLDWSLKREETLADLQEIMNNPYVSTSIGRAMILHDPTSFLTTVQKKVQAAYMEPKWIRARVQNFLGRAQKAMPGLEDAFEQLDFVGICGSLGWVLFSFAVVPLHRIGVIPSSTRQLVQLADSSPGLTNRARELEGSAEMDPEAISDLIQLVYTEAVALMDRTSLGGLPGYFAKKTKWMVNNELHREALHIMWTGFGRFIGVVESSVRNKAKDLCQR